MKQRRVCAAVLLVGAAMAACGGGGTKTAGGAAVVPQTPALIPSVPARATAPGEFPDNPLVAFIPAETPYVLANFQPVPTALMEKFFSVMVPIWTRMFQKALVGKESEPSTRAMRAVLAEMKMVETQGLESIGLSAKARGVLYAGIGAYPVVRVELVDGDRLLASFQRLATGGGHALPPLRERAGKRYWSFDLPEISIFFSISKHEFVGAVAPRAAIETHLPTLLGERPPQTPIAMARFREIAQRDGYGPVGVGFLDLVRVGALAVEAIHAAPACRDAVAGVARRAPLLTFGYGDVTAKRMSFGAVLQLAPELVSELRKVQGSMAGLERVVTGRPTMAFAIAGNVEPGVALGGRVASAVQEVAERCGARDVAEKAREAVASSKRPLPPFVAGVHGAYGVVEDIKFNADGFESIAGFGALQVDHADDLVKMGNGQIPGFEVNPNGTAQPLPAILPVTGHLAANTGAISIAVGPKSETTAPALISDRPLPAPLMVMAFHYGKFGDFFELAAKASKEKELFDVAEMRKLFDLFGLGVIQFLVDERGLVQWATIELR